MAISPLLSKTLIGISGISAVSVGGLVLHKGGFFNKKESIDELTFVEKSQVTSMNWEVKLVNPSSERDYSGAGDSMNVKVSVIGKEKSKDPKTWTCNITGKINTLSSNSTMGVKKQIETALGITSDQPSTILDDKLKKFTENCEKHKEDAVNDAATGSTATIDLGELIKSGDEYKFNEENFKKLFESN